MSGSVRISVILQYCRIHYDDGLCVNYSAHNGEDSNRRAIDERRDRIKEFIESVIQIHGAIFKEMIKGGIPLIAFSNDKSLRLLQIRACDYINTYRNIAIEVAIDEEEFDNIVIERLMPLLEALVDK